MTATKPAPLEREPARPLQVWRQRSTPAEREEIDSIDRLISLLRKRRKSLMDRTNARTNAWANRAHRIDDEAAP